MLADLESRKMKRGLAAPALFYFTAWSFIVYSLRENNKVAGQLDAYLDFNLEEEVVPTADSPDCEEHVRRSIKERSLNDSSHKSNVTTETNRTIDSTVTPSTTEEATSGEVWDDCLVFPTQCPDEIKISWLQSAPFVYDTRSSGLAKNKSEENILIMKGIFHEIITRAIGSCCKRMSRVIPKIRYLKRASNLRVLQRDLLYGAADMIIPVHSDEVKYGGSLPYIKILDSPGVVLIRRHFQSPTTEWKLLFESILGTWPVVLLAFLMSSVAGVFMWALVSNGYLLSKG